MPFYPLNLTFIEDNIMFIVSEIKEQNDIWVVVKDIEWTSKEKLAHTLCAKYKSENPNKHYTVNTIF